MGCSTSRRSMPISASSCLVMSFIFCTSRLLNGPNPEVSSEPRKKFRQIGINGTTARSWYTVAMPTSRASRGEVNFRSSPMTFRTPWSCWCRPAMILIRVDFPAPLSPRTQVTRPLSTAIVTSLSATMLP